MNLGKTRKKKRRGEQPSKYSSHSFPLENLILKGKLVEPIRNVENEIINVIGIFSVKI